jgi:hypothetical protein
LATWSGAAWRTRAPPSTTGPLLLALDDDYVVRHAINTFF